MLYFVNCIVCLLVGSGRFCMLVAMSCIDVLFADWIIIIIIISIIFFRIESTSVLPLSSYRRWSVTVPQVSKALPCSCWLWNRRHFDIDIVILILWYWFRDIDVILIFWNWSCDIDIMMGQIESVRQKDDVIGNMQMCAKNFIWRCNLVLFYLI